ncbi:MAG: GAF and HD-GYP domain-containing protein, partial [Carboxydocellales bacterium]
MKLKAISQRGLATDAIRVPVAVLVFFILLRHTEMENHRAIISGFALISYSILVLIFRPDNLKLKQLLESLKIALDSFWIVWVSSYVDSHIVLVSLMIVQITCVLLHFGFPALKFAIITQVIMHMSADILVFSGSSNIYMDSKFGDSVFFISILAFAIYGWHKEEKITSQIIDNQTDKELKIKNSIEFRKAINLWDDSMSIQEYLYNITLENVGMDGVFFACRRNSNELTVGGIRGLNVSLAEEVTSQNSVAILNKIGKNRLSFSGDIVGEELDDELKKLTKLWPALQKKYSAFHGCIVNYQGSTLGLVLVFLPQSQIFTEQIHVGLYKNITKTSFALWNLQECNYYESEMRLSESPAYNKSKKNYLLSRLACLAAVLLGRMYYVDKCFIALFEDKNRDLKIAGGFGLSRIIQNSELDLNSNIIHAVAVQGESISLKDNDLSSTKKFLGETVTNLLCVPISSKSRILGMVCLVDKHKELSGELADFDNEDEQILRSLAESLGVALENTELYRELEKTFMTTIQAMVNALEARDPHTKGHSERVARYALLIGKELKLSDSQLQNLRFAGILHDIGKIGVPETILHKASQLTLEEYSQMKMHTYYGRQILRPVQIFQELLPAIYHHHERWDGLGYPDGLKEEEIPLEARILAVADAFDAIISQRVYRKSREKEMGINEIIKYTGRQFDPQVVDAFLTAMDKTELSKEELLHWKLDTIRYIYRDAPKTHGRLIPDLKNGSLYV